jgi:hypothetical protein
MDAVKTTVNDDSVEAFIGSVTDDVKKRDGLTLLALFSRITGESPRMWGSSIIGFGQYHYKSERSTREGEWFLTGFSPRKQNLTIYITLGFDKYGDLLAGLGKYTTGKGCLYINKLADVDMSVLEYLIRVSYLAIRQKYS